MNYVDVIKHACFKPTILIFIIILLLVSLFIFANSLYYTIALIGLVVILLFTLVSSLKIRTLTILILCIVYIGAMIILIGYVCAVCPNVVASSSFSLNSPFFLLISLSFFHLIFSSINFSLNSPLSLRIVEYFYSSRGFFIFLTLILILFLTLLIVTSQYAVPKGPFRAVASL